METNEAWEPLEAEEVTFQGYSEYLHDLGADLDWVRIVLEESDAIFAQSGIGGLQLRNERRKIVGTYFGGFLAPEFSDDILQDPEPWIKARAFRAIRAGRPAILPTPERDLEGFADAARRGLHLHIFGFDWLGGFEEDVTYRLRATLANDIVERYHGAPVRMVTVEATGGYIEESEQAGFRVLRRYAGERCAFLIADAESLNVVKTPMHMALFKRTPPRLKLSPVYRRVLYFHARGYSDDEIAKAVGLSRKSIKTYWDRIFTSFEEVVSFGHSGSKRRAVSAYLRLHPEEMWPV